MTQRLQEVPELTGLRHIPFLGQQTDIVAEREQPFERDDGIVVASGQNVVASQPERTGQERTLAAW